MNADRTPRDRRLSALIGGLFSLALAFVSYFWFPGHTWLQQDSQLYVAILEHQRDAAVLRNDPVAMEPHTGYTLWDETAIGLNGVTGLSFHQVLAAEQIATRALGIWGLYLIATAAGLTVGPAWLVVVIVSLGARITGPEVLTFEYEPTPRAFAIPLVMLAIGLAAHRRAMAAAVAGAGAFLFHPPAALPFWAVFAAMDLRRWKVLLPLAGAMGLLLLTRGGEHQEFFGRLTPIDLSLMRMRTAYVFVSSWPAGTLRVHAMVAGVLAAAWLRVRGHGLLMGLAAIGVLSVPVSWLLLEHANLRMIPQLQPMRWLLFTWLAMQVTTAVAGAMAAGKKRWVESFAWFAAALAPPLVPVLGGMSNYPNLHTPELAHISDWARNSTPRDAVFVFPDAGHSTVPGIFRVEAQRALYVDWKSGGQMIYLPDFGWKWWFRWQQTQPFDLAKYDALGVRYAVVKRGGEYVVYDAKTGVAAGPPR